MMAATRTGYNVMYYAKLVCLFLASRVAKFMAASQIVLWFGVLYFGRMIPYLTGGATAGAL